MAAPFDTAPVLDGETLSLRPLAAGDFEGLLAAAGDPGIWAGHPARDRGERGPFTGYFGFLLAAGGTLAIRDRRSGEIIGCSRYYVPPDVPDGIAIGFTFLARRYWGGATNLELKRLMLGHAFARFPEVWFHIAPTNLRSQTATVRLGAEPVRTATLDLSGTPGTWLCYRLTRDAWERRLQARGRGVHG